MGWERKDVAHTTTLPPSAFTDRLYYDTAVFSSVLLRRLVEDADGWTLRTADGSRAAHWEHSVAVTDDGPRILTLPAD